MLLFLEIAERFVIGIMGWPNSRITRRYRHLTDQVQRDVAKRVGGLHWSPRRGTAPPPVAERAGVTQ
ncbi:hypothetical protein [Micromonospora tulbaghiae]|uniref:hypothetical protein n=1 Tax=Micromonospora tulbaghiae TaxID=479978 RepID=UPI0037147264